MSSEQNGRMKAAVYHEYGPPDVVRVEEVRTPVPREGEILVRNHAATVGAADSAARKGAPFFARFFFGLRRPKFPVLGSEFAGEVAAIGPGVTRFAVGDQIFGVTGPQFGAHANYVRLSENEAVAAKPTDLSYADAAALADATALSFLRDKAKLQSGQTILINGASGSVGSAAVQLAKHYGAIVTAVCSGANADLVRQLGADKVVDYTTEDFTRAGQTYDVIFDAAGKSSFARCRPVLSRGGIYLTTVPSLAILVQTLWTARFGDKRAAISFTGLRPAGEKSRDLLFIRDLVAAGQLLPVVDSTFPLAQIADAYRRVDPGHKRGNVVITMSVND
jgi:NADPH:quinone reductase-like Zn-dependent oxidoreductase